MKKLTLIACVLGLLAGCISDDRENFMVPDSFGLTAGDVLIQTSAHAGAYTLGVAKNGKGKTAATATVSLESGEAKAALDKYNSENGTGFKALPTLLFTLDKSTVSYDAEEVVKDVTVSWDPLKVIEILSGGGDYVLPVAISSGDLTVNPDKQVVFLRFQRSTVGIAQQNVNRVINRKQVVPDADGNAPELKETVILDVKMDNFIKGIGMSFPVKIDNSYIAEYNKTSEEQYVAAPEGLVNILTPTVTIPESGESATFKIEIDKSKLMSGGELKAFPSYLVPVTIDTKAISSTRKGENFELKGLAYGNLVTYFTISYLESGLSVVREWGLYSTESGAWSSYIDGFTAGADRNVAIDDNYIYIAETNTTKHLWAISRTDPRNYKLLPVGTVADAGLFYLSCPRIIKNTDSAINGGKDVLAVSNMVEGDPKLYIYDNGIDSDPSMLNMTTWASRRLGDTFTVWGTLQEGVLFFKDFNSTQGTVTFWLRGKTTGTMYLVGRIMAPQATGAGAYFPFPDDINNGVSTVRGGDMAWLTAASKNLYSLEGADGTPTLTELSGYFADSAFRYFDLGKKRYVAYTRQVDSSDGRIFILEGSPEQSWSEIILERNVVYQAAIQNDTEQEKISEEPSPMSSGNSGMDLDIRQVGDDVFLAVVKQNVGLSLFKLTYIY
ncbi:MAG: DUF1735 domain-containing protein [Bacteroidales bacterium]|nr:DUF1735 domain-containing protein [Bacteroidales bacterium]